MHSLFTNIDVLWALGALVPLAIAAAAWSLQMSCGFCSVEPPEFWRAVTMIVIIAFVNVILRFVLQSAGGADGLAPQYIMPGIATAAAIALLLPTGPFTATTITIVQVVLCAALYYALCWFVTLITLPWAI